jgi:hypothetical protein
MSTTAPATLGDNITALYDISAAMHRRIRHAQTVPDFLHTTEYLALSAAADGISAAINALCIVRNAATTD